MISSSPCAEYEEETRTELRGLDFTQVTINASAPGAWGPTRLDRVNCCTRHEIERWMASAKTIITHSQSVMKGANPSPIALDAQGSALAVASLDSDATAYMPKMKEIMAVKVRILDFEDSLILQSPPFCLASMSMSWRRTAPTADPEADNMPKPGDEESEGTYSPPMVWISGPFLDEDG